LYDIRPGNGAGLFLQPGARTGRLLVQDFFYKPDALPVTQPTVSKHVYYIQFLLA